MPLRPEDHAHVVKHAAELLKHPKRGRLLDILADRLAHDDYPDSRERKLDQITYSIARVIDERLSVESS